MHGVNPPSVAAGVSLAHGRLVDKQGSSLFITGGAIVATMTPDASAIAQTIQLSVTPVFLLVATGSLLNVLAGRLSRVVDRSRVLMARWPETEGEEHERVVADLRRSEEHTSELQY